MPIVNQAPVPIREPITTPPRKPDDPLGWRMTVPWIEYFTSIVAAVDERPSRLNSVSRTDQSASISATDFSGGSLSAGLYRVSYYVRVTQAAGTSSAINVTLSWTDGGVSQSRTSASVNGNTTTSIDMDTWLIHVDTNSPVRYATTYISVGSPVMKYRTDLTLELVKV